MVLSTRKIEYLLFQHFFKQSKLVTFRITKNTRIVNHESDVLIVNKNNHLIEFEIKTVPIRFYEKNNILEKMWYMILHFPIFLSFNAAGLLTIVYYNINKKM